jgi:hypothetical protein
MNQAERHAQAELQQVQQLAAAATAAGLVRKPANSAYPDLLQAPSAAAHTLPSAATKPMFLAVEHLLQHCCTWQLLLLLSLLNSS